MRNHIYVARSAVEWCRERKCESLYFLKKNYNYFHFDIFGVVSVSDVGGEEKRVAF